MLIQPSNSTLSEIGTVIVIFLKSEYSWNIFTLLTCYFIVLFFELVKFFRRILFKLRKEIRVDVNEFTVFNSVHRRVRKVNDLISMDLN